MRNPSSAFTRSVTVIVCVSLGFATFGQPTTLNGQSRLSQQLQQRLKSRQTKDGNDARQTQANQSKSKTGVTKSSSRTGNSTRIVPAKSSSDRRNGPTVRSAAKRSQATTGESPATSPQEFVEKLNTAIEGRNLSAFNALISWPTVSKAATRSLKGKLIDEFRTDFLKQVTTRNSLGAQILSTVEAGGSYQFLRLNKSDSTVVATYRMILPGGRGVNYHEFALAKTKSGKVVASDIYVFLAGETLSESIRRNLITAIAQKKADAEFGLTGTDQLLAENVETIKALTEALGKDDAQAARSQIMKLPTELRNDAAIETFTLKTYRGSKAFDTVHERIRDNNPDDVFMDMISIDVYASQKKFQQAIAAIDRIDKRVGGDPHMMILKGRMLQRDGKESEARQLIRSAVKKDDGLLAGYWSLVSFALKDQDHAQTLKLLKTINRKFKVKFRDLRTIPSYAKFVKSAEFKQWESFIEDDTAPSVGTAPTSDEVRR